MPGRPSGSEQDEVTPETRPRYGLPYHANTHGPLGDDPVSTSGGATTHAALADTPDHDAQYAALGHSHPGGSEAFPVGAVFVAVVATSPATLLGYGTWEQIAGGRVLIGQLASDARFDTAEETGGASTFAHGVTQPAAHNAHVVTQPAAHIVTQPGAHSNHVVTQPGAHSNHVVTQPAAHVVTQPANHTTVLNHVHGLSTVLRTATTGSATTQVTDTADTSSTADTTRKTDNPDGGVATITHTGTAVDAHSGAAVDAHSAHAGTAVDAHSAHSGTAVDAHSGAAVDAHSAHSGTAVADHADTTPPYLVVYIWKRTA